VNNDWPGDDVPHFPDDFDRPDGGEEHPDHIGPYRILGPLGEGGMGTVYLAEQTKPLHRRVALKIIRLGGDSKIAIARFETEREALALMNHRNVAKVLHAGKTKTGQLYFVMELVPGIPITEYCDKHRLDTDERLHLFIDVCHGVQHAHQKGIIHRDLKPSNVLVMVEDNEPVPKVIDFGLAKAMQRSLTQLPFATEQGHPVGTFAYMSPEQAEMTALNIDTRTDIYSLGVILYELLVGALPLDTHTLLQAGMTGIPRIIREVEPPKPSTRVSSLEPDSTTVTQQRRTDLRTLSRQISGDLDNIVMKCLWKDRTGRYDTAKDLAVEIDRYLSSEPVLAKPRGAGYLLRKFVRRNRGPVLAAATFLMLLIAGLTGTTFGLLQVQRERTYAEQARNDESAQRRIAEGEKTKAIAARDEAEAVTQFLSDTLGSVDPGKQGKDVTVREILDKAAETVGQRFSDKPLIRARLFSTIGWAYFSLGLYDSAATYTTDAAVIYRQTKGEQDPGTLAATSQLAAIIGAMGGLASAEAQLRATLEIQRRILGDEHSATLASMNSLAVNLLSQRRYAEAEQFFRKVLEIAHGVQADDDPKTLAFVNNLANCLNAQGRYVEAKELFNKALETERRVLGDAHPTTLSSMNNFANSLFGQGQYTEAEELHRKTLEIRHRTLGDDHPDTLSSMNNLANSLYAQGRYTESEELHRRTLEARRRVLGEDHPDTLQSMTNLTSNLLDQGRNVEAEELSRKTLEARRRVQREEHPDTLASINSLAACLNALGRYAEAESLYRQTLAIQRRVVGEEHLDTLISMNNLAVCLYSLGRYAEAEELLHKSLEIERRVLPVRHPIVAKTLYILCGLMNKAQRWGEGESYCREAESIWSSQLLRSHPARQGNLTLIAEILVAQSRFSEAESMLLQNYEAVQLAGSIRQSETKKNAERLAHLYESWDAAEPGKGYSEEAAEYRRILAELSPSFDSSTSQPTPAATLERPISLP